MTSRSTASKRLVIGLWISAGGLALLLAAVSLWPRRSPVRAVRKQALGCTPQRPCMAVVIDDIGRDLTMLRQLLALGGEVTFAVLPHAPHTRQSIAAIRGAGRDYLLHLPMRPLDTTKVTREPVVVGLDGPLQASLEECISKVPGAAGVSNHMGSSVSQAPAEMRQVLRTVRSKGLWYLDSRTSGSSVACAVARQEKVRCLARDVFLDDPPAQAAVQSKLIEAVNQARRRGWSIAIGHPMQVTYRVLGQFLKQPGVRMVRISALLSEADAT